MSNDVIMANQQFGFKTLPPLKKALKHAVTARLPKVCLGPQWKEEKEEISAHSVFCLSERGSQHVYQIT